MIGILRGEWGEMAFIKSKRRSKVHTDLLDALRLAVRLFYRFEDIEDKVIPISYLK